MNSGIEGRKEKKIANIKGKEPWNKGTRGQNLFQGPISKVGGLKAKEHKRGNCCRKLEHRWTYNIKERHIFKMLDPSRYILGALNKSVSVMKILRLPGNQCRVLSRFQWCFSFCETSPSCSLEEPESINNSVSRSIKQCISGTKAYTDGAKEVKSGEERKSFHLVCSLRGKKQVWPFLKHKMPLRVCDCIPHLSTLVADFKLQIVVLPSSGGNGSWGDDKVLAYDISVFEEPDAVAAAGGTRGAQESESGNAYEYMREKQVSPWNHAIKQNNQICQRDNSTCMGRIAAKTNYLLTQRKILFGIIHI